MVYQNQQGYYNALNLADKKNNVTVFIQFMLDVLKFTLDNIIASRIKKTIQHDPVNGGVNGGVNELQKKYWRQCRAIQI
jgi:hypothetical protein